MRESPKLAKLDERDRGLAMRIVLGVTAAVGFLDERIDVRLRGRTKLEPQVRDALRLSSYELLFLDTPASVAVSQGVEVVRGVRPRAAGLANAVLRRVADEDVLARKAALARVSDVAMSRLSFDGNGRSEASPTAALDDLAWASGYPAWLLERMGDVRTDVARAATEPPPVYVAANLAKHDDEETRFLLTSAGLEPQACDVEGAYRLDRPAGLVRSGLVEGADVVVADLSAQRVVSRLPVKPGMRVLEVGQGRGTKSVLLQSMALRAGGSAQVVGIDSVGFKVKVAAERMVRAGLKDAVTCLEFDACALASSAALPALLAEPFDLVFVDAPCSGTGTMRRHPEIPWTLTSEDVTSLARLQLRIIRAVSSRVRPGGALCYATCSLLQEENEDVVEAFLASAEGANFVLEGSPLRTHPIVSGPDGHFMATLNRQE